MMGDAEDKKVGQWFGPNTIAQVLKYDRLLRLNLIKTHGILCVCF